MACLEGYKSTAGMVAAQAIYASVVLLLKVSLDKGMSPMVFVLYRHIVASLCLAPVAYMIHRRSKKVVSICKKDLGLVFAAALIGVTINQILYLTGLHLGSSSLAAAMVSLTPAVTFIMAASIGMEKVGVRSVRSLAKIVGTVVCVGGAILMALYRGQKLPHLLWSNPIVLLRLVGKSWLMACLALLGSCVCSSIWLVLQVPLCNAFHEPLVLSFWMCFFTALQSLVLTPFLQRDPSAWHFSSVLEIFSCIYAGIAGSALTYYIQAWCISRRGPLFSASFTPLCTVMTTLWTFLVAREDLYFGSLIGASAVVIGLYIILWGKVDDAKDDSLFDVAEARSGLIIDGETDMEESLLLHNSNDLRC